MSNQNKEKEFDQKPSLLSEIKNYYLRRLELIQRDLNEDVFMFEILIIVIAISMIYIYTNNNKTHHNSVKMRRVTQKAFIAFIIAYLAHIDMIPATFFIIWLITYYHF
jgi:hypothetical protein